MKPTAQLRFVERDGKKILQQLWKSEPSEQWNSLTTYQEWRDVPLEQEGK